MMVDPAIPAGTRSDTRLLSPVGVATGAGGNTQDNEPPEGRSDAGDDTSGRTRIKKAPNAFRTISEVADDLHIPQHVLRFWETKFPQVRPMKRGGGRRYYRPDDIALLRRISDLLYIQGYTIKGVQRLLREGGGQLSDDIPPPPADERATAEAEPDDMHDEQSELLIPGLELAPDPAPAVPVAVPRAGARRRTDTEADRLRSLLAEALTELEAIRALLG
jgi:DNA-binding transcriptional MerR regulator